MSHNKFLKDRIVLLFDYNLNGETLHWTIWLIKDLDFYFFTLNLNFNVILTTLLINKTKSVVLFVEIELILMIIS